MPMPSSRSHLTPMQLAQAGISIPMGAALLKLRRGCHLGTARRAMREAYAALTVPTKERLRAGLREVVCRDLDIPYGPVLLGAGCATDADGLDSHGMPTAWMITQNRDAIVPSYLRG